MPKMNIDAVSPRMQEIMSVMSKDSSLSVDEIADQTGTSYYQVYPYIRKLEELGLIRPAPFYRDKKKVYVVADTSSTPKIHIGGRDKAPVALYNIAKGAPLAKKNGTETATYLNNMPYNILRLYAIASGIEAGHDEEKKHLPGIRSEMIILRNRLENTIGAVNEILAHPVLSNNPTIVVDTLMGDIDNPLDRETIQRLLKECE